MLLTVLAFFFSAPGPIDADLFNRGCSILAIWLVALFCVLYKRTEPTNLASGGNNLMVRRPNGEFILFQLDGSELHFVQPALCGSCMDASFNGSRRLTRDVDPAGPGLQLDFTVSGKILTVTDDLGNMLSLSPSATCPSRAGALSYRAGTDGVESVYVTYTYDTTCQVLKTVVPSNLTAAPGHSAAPKHLASASPIRTIRFKVGIVPAAAPICASSAR